MKRAAAIPLHNKKADHCGCNTGSHFVPDIGTKENEGIKEVPSAQPEKNKGGLG